MGLVCAYGGEAYAYVLKAPAHVPAAIARRMLTTTW